MRGAAVVLLGQNASGVLVGCVSFHNNRLVTVEVHEDGSTSEGGFKGLKGASSSWDSFEFHAFLPSCGQGGHYFAAALNGPAVKVGQSQQGLNTFYRGWRRPVSCSGNFSWVHGVAVGRDDQAQVLCLLDVEFPFLRIHLKVHFL